MDCRVDKGVTCGRQLLGRVQESNPLPDCRCDRGSAIVAVSEWRCLHRGAVVAVSSWRRDATRCGRPASRGQ